MFQEPNIFPRFERFGARLCFLAVFVLSGSVAQSSFAQNWEVKSDRSAEIAERYYALLLRNPEPGPIFNRWLRSQTEKQLHAKVQALEDGARDNAESLVLALLHLRLKNYDAARSALEQNGTDDDRALRILATIDLERGDIEVAIKRFNTWAERSTSKKTRKARLRVTVDTLLRAARPIDAAKQMELLVELVPNDANIRREYIDILVSNSEYDRALEMYADVYKSLKNGKQRAEVLRDQGDLYSRLNRHQEAISKYEVARTMARGGWFTKAIDHRIVKAHRASGSLKQIYPKIRKRWRAQADMWLELALLAQEVGQRDDAFTFYKKVWNRNRSERRAAEALVHIYQERNDIKSAKRVFTEWIKADPKNIDRRARYADWLYFSAKESDTARIVLKKIRAVGVQPISDVIVAETLVRWGIHQDALDLFEENEKTFKNDPIHAEAYGSLLVKIGQFSEALEKFERLKTDELGKLRFAELTAVHDFEEESMTTYREILERNPNQLSALKAMGKLHEKSLEYIEAGRYYRRAFELSKDTQLIAKIVACARHDEKAEQTFLKNFATKSHWGLVLARHYLASIDDRQKEGVETLQKTIKRSLASGNPRDRVTASIAVRYLATHYQTEHAPQLSVLWWERLARAFPEFRTEGYRQVFGQFQLLPASHKNDILTRAETTVPYAAEVWAQKAYRAAADDKLEDAVGYMQKAVERRPANTDYRFELAFYLVELGFVDRARSAYAEIVKWDAGGETAIDAAFSAIDLCETPQQLALLESMFRSLESQLPRESFITIMLDVYDFIFFDMNDPKLKRRVSKNAQRILAMTLRSEFPDEQSHALRILSEFESKHVWDDILKVANEDPDNDLILAMLARGAYKRATRLFEEASRSDDPFTQRLGWYGLVQVDAPSIRTRMAETLLQDDNAANRVVAAWAVGELRDEKTKRALLQAWESESEPWVRHAMIWSLARHDELEIIAPLLRHKDREVADLAAAALAVLRTDDSRRILLRAMWSEEDRLRKIARTNLTKDTTTLATSLWAHADDYDFQTPDISELITQRLDDMVLEEAQVSIASNYKSFDKPVIEVAREKLNESATRKLVLDDLISIANDEFRRPEKPLVEPVKNVMSALRPSFKKIVKHDKTLKADACVALPFAGKKDDIAFLLSQINSLDDEQDVKRVLGSVGRYPKKLIVPVIEKMLDDSRAPFRLGALVALENVDGLTRKQRAKFARKVEGFVDDQGPIHLVAIETLGTLRDPDSLPALMHSFKRADAEKRRTILSTLRRFRTPKSREMHRRLSVSGVVPPCSDGGTSLPDLLASRCDNLYETEAP